MQENITTGPQFEQNISTLEKTVTEIADKSPESMDEKEIIRASLKEAAQKNAAAITQSKKSDDANYDMPAYVNISSNEEANAAVNRLISMALKDDLFKALSLANKSTPFIEDAFHDALVDQLLPELKRRGIMK